MDGTDDGKRHNPTRHSNATITTPNNTDFDMQCCCGQCDVTVDGDDVDGGNGGGIVFVFAFGCRFILFFLFSISRMSRIHTIIGPEKKTTTTEYVRTFSMNVNRRKSLMNSTHTYVLHSVRFFRLVVLFSGQLPLNTVILLRFKEQKQTSEFLKYSNQKKSFSKKVDGLQFFSSNFSFPRCIDVIRLYAFNNNVY